MKYETKRAVHDLLASALRGCPNPSHAEKKTCMDEIKAGLTEAIENLETWLLEMAEADGARTHSDEEAPEPLPDERDRADQIWDERFAIPTDEEIESSPDEPGDPSPY